jgi:hypothetical protein
MADSETIEPGAQYINIGTEKACLFVRMSRLLLNQLRHYPLLYYAVEEALECAKIGYYSAGILVFAQLLNCFNEETPNSRNMVAHELLKRQPNRDTFDSVVAEFKRVAALRYQQESHRSDNADEFDRRINREWWELMRSLSPSQP